MKKIKKHPIFYLARKEARVFLWNNFPEIFKINTTNMDSVHYAV